MAQRILIFFFLLFAAGSATAGSSSEEQWRRWERRMEQRRAERHGYSYGYSDYNRVRGGRSRVAETAIVIGGAVLNTLIREKEQTRRVRIVTEAEREERSSAAKPPQVIVVREAAAAPATATPTAQPEPEAKPIVKWGKDGVYCYLVRNPTSWPGEFLANKAPQGVVVAGETSLWYTSNPAQRFTSRRPYNAQRPMSVEGSWYGNETLRGRLVTEVNDEDGRMYEALELTMAEDPHE